jgi:ABC-type branched-subunit amino acid transport system ATPase component/predicted MFS family arabinose efflux permease
VGDGRPDGSTALGLSTAQLAARGPAANLVPDTPMSTREVFRSGGWGLVGTVLALNFVDEFGVAALSVLAPDVQDSLGLSDTTTAVLVALGLALVLVGAGPLAVLADRTRRLTLISVTSLLLGVFTLLTGLAQNAWQIATARVGAGLQKGNLPAFNSLLADAVPIAGRARVFSAFDTANAVARVLTPATVGVIASIAGGDEGWRWAFAACAVPTFLLGVLVFFQREPTRGGHERAAVLGANATPDEAAARHVRFSEAAARLKRIKTFHDSVLGFGAIGVALFATPTFINLLLEDAYGLDTAGRGAVGSVAAVGGLIGTVLAGARGDKLFASDPSSVLRVGSLTLLSYLLLVPAVHMPSAPWFTVLSLAANVGMFMTFTLIGVGSAAIVPPHLRSMGFAVTGLSMAIVGGLGGAVVGGALSSQYGERTALTIVLTVVIPLGAYFLRRASRSVVVDIAAVARDISEDDDRQRRAAARRGADPAPGEPLLEVRHLDAAYGSLRVLFDVDVEVRRNEVLALLGTNGAGKSTLLRVVTGLTLPTGGSVVLDGEDITYLQPDERVRRGIVMMPGGKAVFEPLSVDENLRIGGFLLRADDRVYRARRDNVLDLFPVLRERLAQPAGTLSGGERQMLALAKAMLLEPTVLCIDELSLGLAPVVVQELLEVVAGLRATGVTMVIVEQSVNVALTIADRAIFMEKGHVRFEGPAADLAERDDLVRAVFLGSGR